MSKKNQLFRLRIWSHVIKLCKNNYKGHPPFKSDLERTLAISDHWFPFLLKTEYHYCTPYNKLHGRINVCLFIFSILKRLWENCFGKLYVDGSIWWRMQSKKQNFELRSQNLYHTERNSVNNELTEWHDPKFTSLYFSIYY